MRLTALIVASIFILSGCSSFLSVKKTSLIDDVFSNKGRFWNNGIVEEIYSTPHTTPYFHHIKTHCPLLAKRVENNKIAIVVDNPSEMFQGITTYSGGDYIFEMDGGYVLSAYRLIDTGYKSSLYIRPVFIPKDLEDNVKVNSRVRFGYQTTQDYKKCKGVDFIISYTSKE